MKSGGRTQTASIEMVITDQTSAYQNQMTIRIEICLRRLLSPDLKPKVHRCQILNLLKNSTS